MIYIYIFGAVRCAVCVLLLVYLCFVVVFFHVSFIHLGAIHWMSTLAITYDSHFDETVSELVQHKTAMADIYK